MNFDALKKAIMDEIDFVKKRLDYYQTLVSTEPDNLTAFKMLYSYKGKLDILNSLYWRFL